MKARRYLDLPLNKKIVLAYGADSLYFHADLFPVFEKLSRNYPVLFLLLSHHTQTATQEFKLPSFFLMREEMPPDDRLYAYLYASDAYIYYGRMSIGGVGVSSCVTTCLGAGRPVLVPAYCNFFDLSGEEVVKYGALTDLEQKFRDIFNGTESIKKSLAAAHEYASANSAPRIAEQFLRLFEEINAG
jgi:hypothetical protein